MKHFYLPLIALLFFVAQLKAQAPNQLNYQGVARDASGNVMANQAVSLRFTIHQGTTGGTIVYQETKAATTNLLGLFTVAIGSGVVVTGNFSTIAWGANAEFLQVEMDPTGGTTYLNMGTNQFLSVPYALNSGSSTTGWSVTGNSISTTFGTNFIGSTNNAPLEFIANNAFGGVIDYTKNNIYFGSPNPSNGITTGAGNNDAGSQNVAIGNSALATAGANSNANVAVGSFALLVNPGTNNLSGNNGSVAVGGYTLRNSTGNPNTSVGYQAGYGLTTGVNNVAVGYEAAWSQSTGSKNVAIGDSALDDVNPSTNSNSFNTAIGTSALRLNTTGNYNVAVGYSAGITNIPGNANVSGSQNTYIGYDAGPASATQLTNATAIGAGALAPTANSVTLGNGSVTGLYVPGYNTIGSMYYTSAANGLVAGLAPGATGTILKSNGAGLAPSWLANGSNGQVLTIVSGVPAWAAASSGSGTVTSIATGAGLTGGTITTNGTISLANGTSAGQILVSGSSPFTPTLQTVSQDAAMNGSGAVTVQGIQTVPVSATAPVTGNVMAFNGTQWVPTTGGGAGKVLQYNASGAPTWVTPSGGGISSVAASSPLTVTNPTTAPSISLVGPNGGVLYGTGSGTAFLGAGPLNEVLVGQGAGQPPTWTTMAGLTGTGDNWGTQVAITDSTNTAPGLTQNTIAGNGTGSSPLRLSQQGATSGQVLTWNGTTWVPGGGSGWQLTGNSGTTPGTSFIGTTDAKDVVFKAHNAEVMRIGNTNNNVGIGTPTPNAGAVLDVSSSTQGMLIPRLTGNPASPVQSMMYYNTTSGCFMFYNGTTWQSIVCGCPNVATAGAITGTVNFCPGAAGVTYSIPAVGNATAYQWTAPAGATITAGQGSNSIALTEGTTASSISVTASNNCGTGPVSTLALTPVSSIITGQPSNFAVSCASPGNATFTVTASGSPTYQWQVSTNGGSAYTPLTNTAPYSGATTATLTVANPPSTMNGYLYECVVTGACSFTSNAAALSSGLSSIPIQITNSVSATTTAANLNVKVSIAFNTAGYSGAGLNASLNNVLFSTGPGGSGTPLYAWIESPTAPTATTTEFTTTPTSANATAAVVWINLGSLTVANGAPVNIYMTFMPYTIMTGTTGFTGFAPQLTSTYGQFDNGALVFPNFYDNFAGTSLASKWTLAPSCTVTLNNAITAMSCPGHWYGIYTNTFSNGLNTVAESYCKSPGVNGQGLDIHVNGVEDEFAGGTNILGFGTGGTLTSSSGANQNQAGSVIANDWYVFGAVITNTPAPVMQLNYTTALTGNAATQVATNSGVGLGVSSITTPTFQWFRDRVLPPGGTLPTTLVGALGCF